jgi:hypothetical protein
MSNEAMRVTFLDLPPAPVGFEQRIAHVDIPFSDGRLGCIEFPWPMTPEQKEAFHFQLDHHLELLRRFFVKREEQDELAMAAPPEDRP